MNDTNDISDTTDTKNFWWVAMLRDVQFWVPLLILIAGLILVSAIQ
jgi:hypothetical protein